MRLTGDYEYDVLILGSGISGLCCALKLLENKKLKIAVVSASPDKKECNSFYAQGGVVFESQNIASLKDDILEASSGTSNPEAVEYLCKNSASALEELLLKKGQVSFNRDQEGELLKTREGAHSHSRIIYRGDYTGKSIVEGLNEILEKHRDQIHFYSGKTAVDLITPNHHGTDFSARYQKRRVCGAYILDHKTKAVEKWMAKAIVLATGGLGALYLHHTNWEGARGDGQAMAKRAGAHLLNMEFIQFHPTTFYEGSHHRRFLISEAVRGEGARLLDEKGRPFMKKYHSQGELASRDVVSKAIWQEMIESGASSVYLDITHKGSAYLQDRFPTIFDYLHKKKIDMGRDLIPVVPAAHYSCGGIQVDWRGRTDLFGLYAIGEVSCTGLHGANRLASTSLLEGVLWGRSAALDILNKLPGREHYPAFKIRSWEGGGIPQDSALIKQDFSFLRHTMWNYVGLLRSPRRLLRAQAMFNELYNHVQQFYQDAVLSDSLIGLRNSLEVAQSVVRASMRMKQSVGCFQLESETTYE